MSAPLSCSNSMRLSNLVMSTLLPSSLRRLLTLAALSAASVLFAQERDYSFADETIETLAKYKAATDAKDNKLALSILDGLLAKLPPDSYDAAFVLVQKAQLYVQAGEYAKAIEPMERGVRLSDSKTPTYFED